MTDAAHVAGAGSSVRAGRVGSGVNMDRPKPKAFDDDDEEEEPPPVCVHAPHLGRL
jgi:hypothetical protein